jgi:hypothetical protein
MTPNASSLTLEKKQPVDWQKALQNAKFQDLTPIICKTLF